jgi:tRNA(Ile)-lysidine synthase
MWKRLIQLTKDQRSRDAEQMNWLQHQGAFTVAYSGGADSTALLLMAARAHPGKVSAVHVHHGLQAAADDFAGHCEAFCAALDVPLQVLRVNAQAAPGQSPEEAARKARYSAIAECFFKGNQPLAQVDHAATAINLVANSVQLLTPTVLLAQHADDQVETLLLALSRGAGVDGLAGMAAQFERHGLQWARPFLMPDSFMGAQEIRDWLAAQGLQARMPGSANLGQGWVEDPTNTSMSFTRNRIRAKLLPALAEVFPQYRETFARSARNMAQAQQILAAAAIDLVASIGLPPSIKKLQILPRLSQANYLRHWLKTQHHAMGSEAQMNELLDQIAACTTRVHQIRLKLASGYVRREADVLAYSTGLEPI